VSRVVAQSRVVRCDFPEAGKAGDRRRVALLVNPALLDSRMRDLRAVGGSDREDGLAPRERWAGSRSGLAVTAISVAVTVLLNLFARLLFGHVDTRTRDVDREGLRGPT
jgi:hypothetical protein